LETKRTLEKSSWEEEIERDEKLILNQLKIIRGEENYVIEVLGNKKKGLVENRYEVDDVVGNCEIYVVYVFLLRVW